MGRGWAGRRPIVTRLVVAVALAMAAVLLVGAGFVYWRVRIDLDNQLDRDLDAYREVAESNLKSGTPLVRDTPGLSYQVYARDGAIRGGDFAVDHNGDGDDRLIPASTVRAVASSGKPERGDVGHLLPPEEHAYRWVAAAVDTPHGAVVAAYAINRSDHDESLRELLVQLTIADLATLVAASFVGYRTARGALDPVERYRRTAATAGGRTRLSVGERDDELSRLGHTFNELLDRIERSTERERQFLADASHELRSPLTVMRTEVEWALLKPAETASRETLESLRGQVDRLVRLCNALLDLEELRAEPGAARDELALVDIAADVVTRWRPVVEDAGRELVADVPEHLVVRGNMHWLELAVDNLVSNALRYGEGEIRLGATAGGARVHLWLEDDGRGFPPDFVDRAFDRFARAEESRASGGTGLGLAIVAAIAENHQGTVAIDGSRVTVTLPAAG